MDMPFRLLLILLLMSSQAFGKECTGHFVNPLKDICWRCLFPLSIGNSKVVHSSLPDTENPTMLNGVSRPIEICPSAIGFRIGLNIGFWEPFSLVDVTDTPYCLVNLGGHKLNLGLKQGRGGKLSQGLGSSHAFYHVHWYKYPLIYWLNLITSLGCMQGGEFDVAYMTELDPTWRNSSMSFVLNPDAILFSNPVAQASCAADGVASTATLKPLDHLFWCAGTQGNIYPLNGHIHAPISPVQSALLLAERMNFKLHREPPFIYDSSPRLGEICKEHHYWVTPKSRYRYEMVNQVADGKHCYPSGYSTLGWEALKIKAGTPQQYGFLLWRKRNCTFL